MSPDEKGLDRKIVPCARCRTEVPVSEASVAEAVDYIIHFCGLECYAKWAEQRQGADYLPKLGTRLPMIATARIDPVTPDEATDHLTGLASAK